MFVIGSRCGHKNTIVKPQVGVGLKTTTKKKNVFVRLLPSQVCIEEESQLFFLLLPALCQHFPSSMVGSHQLLCLIATHVDPAQVRGWSPAGGVRKLSIYIRASVVHCVILSNVCTKIYITVFTAEFADV